MNTKADDKRTVFSITAEDVQDIALSVAGRRLTDEEMRIAEKCIESGLTHDIDVVFKAAIETAVEQEIDLREGKL